MAWPKVSAIVRTYNVADLIEETLGAIGKQDYPGKIEIILVDSGSTDNTLEIASPWADHVVQLPPGTYKPGRALNLGAKTAQGEILFTLSSDAVPTGPDHLKHLVTPFQDPKVATTYGRHLPRPGASPSQARDCISWFPLGILENPAERYSAADSCIRYSVWQRYPFDEVFIRAEDFEWAQRISSTGRQIQYVPEATVIHSHSPQPSDIYTRAFRQRRAVYSLDPHRWRFNLWHALRFCLGLSILDAIYALRNNFATRWLFHIPLYRTAQAWGLYRGAQAAKKK